MIDLSPPLNHPSSYTWLIAFIWPKTVNFTANRNPKPRNNSRFCFSADPEKRFCISTQVPWRLPALNVKTSVLGVRWSVFALCSCGSLLPFAQFYLCFLQPVISQCTYLKPLFFASIPPQLYKETVFVLCVFVTSFAVSHYESKLVILSPLDLDLS